MKFSILLVWLLLVLASHQGFGQDTLSLTQLWERAFANYPGLEAYRSQQRQADIHEKLTRNKKLPEVILQAQNSFGTQNSISGAFFPLPGLYNVGGTGVNEHENYASNLFGSVVLDWKFMQFGRLRKSMEAAKIFTQQANYRIHAEQLALQAKLTRAFLQLLYYQRMQDWASVNTERLQTVLLASGGNVKAGLAPGADSLLVNASLNQTVAAYHKWLGLREEAKTTLSQWVNMPADHIRIRNQSLKPGNLSQDPDSNYAIHPQLAFKQAQKSYAEKQKELAALSGLPSLSLLGGVQIRGNSGVTENSFYESWGGSYLKPVENFLIGAGLSWNISNLFDTRLKKEQYREETYQRQAETEELALSLRSQNETARQQIAQSIQQISNAEQAYEAAKKAYGLFAARYNSGLISITDLLQIQDILQNTEKTRIEAYYQYWAQQANLAESTADFSYLQNVFQ